MKTPLKEKIKTIIKRLKLNCTNRDFRNKAYWGKVSIHQNLSEDFIREFQNKVNWVYISAYQNLSEDFIREFQDKVDWSNISYFQPLSEKFIKKFKDKIDKSINCAAHKQKTLKQKEKEIKAYAKRHNLRYENGVLYAFRIHDKHGRGEYNKTIFYEKGKYYRDWHCDMREDVENSFGLGVWPKGNTPVAVKVEDWGVKVNRGDGKARVWGFTVLPICS